MGIPDAVVELPAQSATQPADDEAASTDSLRREVRAVRHLATTQIGEIHGRIGGVLTEIGSLRLYVSSQSDRNDRIDYALTGLAASHARLERRLLPAAWSGVALGLAMGSILSQVLQAWGRA